MSSLLRDPFKVRIANRWIIRLGAWVSIAVLILLPVLFFRRTVLFFGREEVSIISFIFSRQWLPESGSFGAGAFFGATLRTSFLAVVFAVPGSLVLSLYLSDYAAVGMQRRYRIIIDILSSIPAVAYGLFAVIFLTPVLQWIAGYERVGSYNTFAAAVMLSGYLTPYLTSIYTNALVSDRYGIRRAAAALGATKTETLFRIVIPDKLPAILSGMVLGFSRAVGESVIVGMAAGFGPGRGWKLFMPAETVTGYILRTGSGAGEVLFGFGGLLLLFTLLLNFLGDWVAGRRSAEELR